MDFAAPVDHRVKLKESEKKDKYLDLAWKLKKTNKQTVEHESDVLYQLLLVLLVQSPKDW